MSKAKKRRRSKRSTLVCGFCGCLGADMGDNVGFMARSGWRFDKSTGETKICCPKCRTNHIIAHRPDLTRDECAALAYAGK
jgi:hypothetical protein